MPRVFDNKMHRDSGTVQHPLAFNGLSGEGSGPQDVSAVSLRDLEIRQESAPAFTETRTHVRYFLAFWLFVLSGVAFLDRTNISISGLQISKEYGIDNQQLGWIFSSFLIGYAALQVPCSRSL